MIELFGARVVVFAAHADDETLGVGGTIARLTTAGVEVTVAIATDSTSAQYPGDAAIAVRRWEQCAAAMALLGVTDLARLGAPDMGLDDLPGVSLAAWTSQVVRDRGASAVLAVSPADANADHRALAAAAGVAARPVPGSTVDLLAFYETPSSSEWGGLQGLTPLTPDLGVDIAAHLGTKLAAVGCYADELRDPPHPRSPAGVESLARVRGSQFGVDAAEALAITMVRAR